MNYMKQVAKMLGVELGEEFRIKNSNRVFVLVDEGCYSTHVDSNGVANEHYLLSELLSGICEIEKPILDKQEKQYLENVIRPFKDRIRSITKYKTSKKLEYISVHISGSAAMWFPYFRPGSMYKGMEIKKEYTLKELGLFEDE